jgi:hypothetical protein
MGLRVAILTSGLTGGLFLAGQACAASNGLPADAFAVGNGSPNFKAVSIPVTVTVGFACGFTATVPTSNPNLPNLDAGYTNDTAFGLNCSGPSRIAVVSRNGGLLTSGTVPTGYTTLAPYTVAVHMVGNGAVAVDATCAIADIVATTGSCSFRGPAGSSSGLTLGVAATNVAGSYIRITAPVYAGAGILVASSNYADILDVTLAPAS